MTAAAQPAGATLGPVQSGERIATLDILRGFALFGILLVNFRGTPGAGWTTVADTAAQWFLQVGVSWKFYPMFSFLFGLGVGIQLLRARARGVPVVPVYLRRMLVLFAIGVAHYILLWDGDILRDYAVLGVILILFRNLSPRALLVCALAAFAVFTYLPRSDQPPRLSRPDPQASLVVEARVAEAGQLREEVRAYARWATSEGSYPELVAARAIQWWRIDVPNYVSTRFARNSAALFGMFLLGLYAARRRLFEDVEAHLRFARWAAGFGLGLGLALNLYNWGPRLGGWTWLPELPGWLGEAVWTQGGHVLAVGYIAGITLLVRRPRAGRVLGVLAPVGRMALTNYLLQSVAGTMLFYGYTFGLYGRIAPAVGVGMGVLIFALQIPLSHWWMARYRFGPAEWLWRTLTYMRLQPMRPERQTRPTEPALAPAGAANFPRSP